MTNTVPWRKQFIGLATDLQRAQKVPVAKIADDPKAVLRVPIQVDGVGFELIHLPQNEDQFVMHCAFGRLPKVDPAAVMKKALLINQTFARGHSSMFALRKETDELIYSAPDSLQNVNAAALLPALSQIASFATQWRKNKLVDV